MSKNRSRGIAASVILLAVFSIIAFAVPFAKTAVFRIGYGCGVFAVLFQIYLFRSAFAEQNARSRFYGFPIVRLGILYLIAQLVISIIEFALSGVLPVWVAVIVNALLLAFVLLGCVAAETARDEVIRQDRQIRKDTNPMRELQSLAEVLTGQCEDPEIRKALIQLAEELRYSDPVSSEKTAPLEAEMKNQMETIRQALAGKDAEQIRQGCEKLLLSLKERNRICKMSK